MRSRLQPRYHPFDVWLVLTSLVLCLWVSCASSFGPFSAESALRDTLSDFVFPAQSVTGSFDGQTDVRVDWNRTPDVLFASGTYPAVVTFTGAVPERFLTTAEWRDYGTFERLFEQQHIHNVSVAVPVEARRVGLSWKIEGLAAPEDLLELRTAAFVNDSTSGSTHLVKDRGVYGTDGGYFRAREGNYSTAWIFSGIVFGTLLLVGLYVCATSDQHRTTAHHLFLLGCMCASTVCVWWLCTGLMSLMAISFT